MDILCPWSCHTYWKDEIIQYHRPANKLVLWQTKERVTKSCDWLHSFLAKCTFWLANTFDPFARGLHAHASLFICTFSWQFFSSMSTLVKNNSYFATPKIWKKLIILPEMRNIIPVRYQILSLSFFPGLHLRNLRIKASRSWISWLNKGTRHSEMDWKKQPTGLYQPFKVSNALQEF